MSDRIVIFPVQLRVLSGLLSVARLKMIKTLVVSVVIVGFFSVDVVEAQSQGQPYHPQLEQPAGAKISPDQAMTVAKKQGRVLSIVPVQKNGQWIYRVKMLNGQGQVSVIFVDGNTGELLQP